ncbi:hypothetical protein [Fodinicola feengrottensis]|uniref:DUF2637 domain-containing protein n=1 Tax=Fodinicola feengrottensis TaxID=435914 RepID=A0ABN2FR49_9ACTN|nr:hypothetical protein [Fodinicola feengrottensis]
MTTLQDKVRDSPRTDTVESATPLPPDIADPPSRLVEDRPPRRGRADNGPTTHIPTHAAAVNGDPGFESVGHSNFWTNVGILTVGLTSGTISWTAWSHMAEIVGMTGSLNLFGLHVQLAWLLPIAVDVFLVTTTGVWQSRSPRADPDMDWMADEDGNEYPSKFADDWEKVDREQTDPILTFARRCALGAMAASVGANAAYHQLTLTAGVNGVWSWIAMAAAALPPVMLALVAHLRALLTADRRHTDQRRAAHRRAVLRWHAEQMRSVPQDAGPDEDASELDDTDPDCEERTVKADLMRAYFRAHVAHGHIPTGQEMADHAHASGSHARTVRRDLLETLSPDRPMTTRASTPGGPPSAS